MIFPRNSDLKLLIRCLCLDFILNCFRQAAASKYRSLLLAEAAVMLPLVLGDVVYSYYVFRGKTSDEAL